MTEDEVKALVGLPVEEAERRAAARGLPFRVAAQDGEEFMLTADYRPDRVNVHVVAGKVTVASLG